MGDGLANGDGGVEDLVGVGDERLEREGVRIATRSLLHADLQPLVNLEGDARIWDKEAWGRTSVPGGA